MEPCTGMNIFVDFNASTFYSNMIGNVLAVWLNLLGVFFYAFLLLLIFVYVLLHNESWPAASVVGLFMLLIFGAVIPQIIVLLVIIAVIFVFAGMIVHILVT